MGKKMPHSEGGLEWGEGDPTGGRPNHKFFYFAFEQVDVVLAVQFCKLEAKIENIRDKQTRCCFQDETYTTFQSRETVDPINSWLIFAYWSSLAIILQSGSRSYLRNL